MKAGIYFTVIGSLLLGGLVCALNAITDHLPDLLAVWVAAGVGVYFAGALLALAVVIIEGLQKEPLLEQLQLFGMILIWPGFVVFVLYEHWRDIRARPG